MAAKKNIKKRGNGLGPGRSKPDGDQGLPLTPADRPPTEVADERRSDAARPDFPVVGIGASAGGLDAFRRFFGAMPADAGMAFVLVPHLDPTHESLMVELMAKTDRDARRGSRGRAVDRGQPRLYHPPNRFLTTSEGRLRLTVLPDPRGRQTALDIFFRSLADDRTRAVDRHRALGHGKSRHPRHQGNQAGRRDGDGPRTQFGRIRPDAQKRHRHRPGRLCAPPRTDAQGADQVRPPTGSQRSRPATACRRTS